jgi:translation initiation factor 1
VLYFFNDIFYTNFLKTMSKKINKSSSPLVYSTDPNYLPPIEREEVATLSAEEQPLKILLETKQRAGKTVTIVLGFVGTEEAMNTLGKALKNHCGTGGSVKDGEIIIQGDHRQKIFQYLKVKGYKKAKL